MILGLVTLTIALILSAVSGYYSIIGLTAIFAGEFWAVFIMGAALESSKLVAASWLYRNWPLAPKYLKIYLTSGLIVLMLITSLGIFGFLSKAHLESSSNLIQIETTIANLNSEISTKKTEIDEVRIKIKDLDKGIEQYYSRGAVTRGLDALQKQEGIRSKFEERIKIINAEILELEKKKNQVNTDVRNEKLKVGPIKYVTALLFGDDKDEKLLEKSIQYLILMIIFTFDPMAVLLLIAANISFYNRNKVGQPITSTPPKKNYYVPKAQREKIEKELLEKVSNKYSIKEKNSKEKEKKVEVATTGDGDKWSTKKVPERFLK